MKKILIYLTIALLMIMSASALTCPDTLKEAIRYSNGHLCITENSLFGEKTSSYSCQGALLYCPASSQSGYFQYDYMYCEVSMAEPDFVNCENGCAIGGLCADANNQPVYTECNNGFMQCVNVLTTGESWTEKCISGRWVKQEDCSDTCAEPSSTYAYCTLDDCLSSDGRTNICLTHNRHCISNDGNSCELESNFRADGSDSIFDKLTRSCYDNLTDCLKQVEINKANGVKGNWFNQAKSWFTIWNIIFFAVAIYIIYRYKFTGKTLILLIAWALAWIFIVAPIVALGQYYFGLMDTIKGIETSIKGWF